MAASLFTFYRLKKNKTIKILCLTVLLTQLAGFVAKGQPALIPMPQEITWGSGDFQLGSATIQTDTSLSHSAIQYLQGWLASEGIKNTQLQQPVSGKKSAAIAFLYNEDLTAYGKEAYQLTVKPQGVTIQSHSELGFFRAVTTLRQLGVENNKIASCQIRDWPAFQWRGIMHDVGRNFISLDELKKQVSILARYKINVFHWHLTENVAWRLQIKKYPQLTDAEHMTRNKGQYYTQEEAREFVRYCQQLGVTVLPEIDMPGHSAAFERAMGVNMQSDEGIRILKNILEEVCEVFDVPYIHIGGDEVEITNPDFLPEMTRFIRHRGKQVVGWRPGGNLDDDTIDQLWTGHVEPEKGIKTIDSRHLYLNHNDPLSGVYKTFSRQLCDAPRGDSLLLGAILCAWPDRRVGHQDDIIKMNGFYPSALAFAERAWIGGGYKEPTALIPVDNSLRFHEFVAFEKRLIRHRDCFFQGEHFPYIRQTDIVWNITRPQPNEGDLAKTFAIETAEGNAPEQGVSKARGATVWLRHMWHPLMQGVLPEAQPNHTAYAYTYVFSPQKQQVGMWISFHNPGRANDDDTPKTGQWDYKQSKIWVNDKEIAPPQWLYPGRKGDMEVPLVDESYEWRPATQVNLEKGWNKVLIKLPIGKFKSSHTAQVKWMFTAAFVHWDGSTAREIEGLKYSVDPKGKQ